MMKHLKRLTILTLIGLILSSCTPQKTDTTKSIVRNINERADWLILIDGFYISFSPKTRDDMPKDDLVKLLVFTNFIAGRQNPYGDKEISILFKKLLPKYYNQAIKQEGDVRICE